MGTLDTHLSVNTHVPLKLDAFHVEGAGRPGNRRTEMSLVLCFKWEEEGKPSAYSTNETANY